MTALGERLSTTGLPPPPPWVAGIPLVGAKAVAAWERLSSAGPDGLATQVTPYLAAIGRFVLGQLGSVGGTLLQFLLVVVLSAIRFRGLRVLDTTPVFTHELSETVKLPLPTDLDSSAHLVVETVE